MDTLIPNHYPAPGFTLPDLDRKTHSLTDYVGKIVVVNFWSAECPGVKRTDHTLVNCLKIWGDSVVLLPIASNANETPEMLTQVAAERGLSFVLHDTGQRVADIYGVQTTPHLFIIDTEGILRYQGAFDDVTFRQREPTQFYVQQAVESLLTGARPDPAQTPPYGCALVRYTL